MVGIVINGSNVDGCNNGVRPAFSLYGSPVTVWVEYDENTTTLKVFMAQDTIKPAAPLLTRIVDIRGTVGATAFVGFTAATGVSSMDHDILSWNWNDFDDVPKLAFNGTAKQVGNVLRLVPATAYWQRGSLYPTTPLPITSFQSRFQFLFQNAPYNPADGMTFVIQRAGITALGVEMAGLGYKGITPSVAVYFDKYGCGGDKVGIAINGSDVENCNNGVTPPFSLYGSPVTVWVEYDEAATILKVFMAQNSTKPATPLLTQTVNLKATVGATAFVGFTAATGGLSMDHDILNWSWVVDNFINWSWSADSLPFHGPWSVGAGGQYSSLALDSRRNPVISYFDNVQRALMVMHCSNPICSSINTTVAVDNTIRDTFYTSLKLDSSGNPVISYFDQTNADLKLARCGNPSCSTRTVVTVDSAGVVGQFSSLVLDSSGNPVISYHDGMNLALKLVHCGNPTCSSGNTIVTVDIGVNVGQHTSLALDSSGNPVISYYDQTNRDLNAGALWQFHL